MTLPPLMLIPCEFEVLVGLLKNITPPVVFPVGSMAMVAPLDVKPAPLR